MSTELPYLASYKNVSGLFEKIRSAKIPEAVTTRYLADTLGFGSSGDRALIALLKLLGFIDASGVPTKDYASLKHEKVAKGAIAAAIRRAYEPLFSANEQAHALPPEEVRGLIAQVSGADDGMTSKIMGTFKALCAVADFNTEHTSSENKEKPKTEVIPDEVDSAGSRKSSLRPDFHYNIQVHLPTNATEETYINIFNAIRRVFK